MRPKDFLNLTDPEAIATNRRGQLSPSQRTLRTRFLRQQLVGGLFFLLFLGGLTIFGLVKEGGSGQTINSTGVLVFLALMGGAILLVISLSSVGAVSFYWSMTGEIAQAEGRVLWKGYYAAEIPGRTLTTPYNIPLDLPPGPYRFYFVGHSGRLLSAEALDRREGQLLETLMPADTPPTKALPPIAQSNMRVTSVIILGFMGLLLFGACPFALASSTPQDIPMLLVVYGTFTFIYLLMGIGIWWSTRNFYGVSGSYGTDLPARNQALYALASSLRFDQTDLAANRSGRITPRQKRRLLGHAFFSALGGVALFMATIVALLGFWANNQANLQTNPLTLLCPLAVMLLVVGGAVMLLMQAIYILGDFGSGRVLQTAGPAHKRIGGGRNVNFYVSVRHSPEFQINHPTYQAFLESQPYRLYYTANSHKLLAAEPED